jgi:hypothetical protein
MLRSDGWNGDSTQQRELKEISVKMKNIEFRLLAG